MSVLDQPILPFTIPSEDELEAITDRLHTAACKIDEVHIGLLHATGGVEVPLREFAEQPTLADIGALYSFADYIDSIASDLTGWSAAIRGTLSTVNLVRRHWDEDDAPR